MPEGGTGQADTSKEPSQALPLAMLRAVSRLTHFSGELEQITVSYNFSFTDLLAKKSHLRTGDTTLIGFTGQDFLHTEL